MAADGGGHHDTTKREMGTPKAATGAVHYALSGADWAAILGVFTLLVIVSIVFAFRKPVDSAELSSQYSDLVSFCFHVDAQETLLLQRGQPRRSRARPAAAIAGRLRRRIPGDRADVNR